MNSENRLVLLKIFKIQHDISINVGCTHWKMSNRSSDLYVLCTLLFCTALSWSLKFPWVGGNRRFHSGRWTLCGEKSFLLYFFRNLCLNPLSFRQGLALSFILLCNCGVLRWEKCVCVYIYIHICIYVYTHTHIFTLTYIFIYTHIFTHTHTHTHTHAHTKWCLNNHLNPLSWKSF